MTIALETKRLILKPIALSDLDNIYALRSDPEVMKYIADSVAVGSVHTRERVKDFIECGQGYFEKYGMDFFSVFEKESGAFVGQAGIFHLHFKINQPDIDLAYRLHKKYWNKGYATELAKALINYGFNTLSLSKILAFVLPENKASRNVLEKAGMSYRGLVNFGDTQLPSYEIYNKKIDYNKIKLILATMDDYPIIQNMASYYAYDISEYMEWAQQKDGTHSIGIDFIKYWKTENTFPFIIKYEDELVGFVIVDQNVSDVKNDFNIAQFFILRKFLRKGIGKNVAFQCFDKFIGKWEAFVMPGNEGAYRFWRKIIGNYTNNKFKEFTRIVNKNTRNIFEFNSRELNK
ncbi:MAG: GNAT family N-acetyltransferase [Gammaproteobacteria bacterium]|nr:GNAT family N-acetyltransferase [Gammaproteobacteria bacterium]